MWFHSLLPSWKSGVSRSRRPQPRPAQRRTRLALEQLEDRLVPTNYSAANVSALIADINAANTAGGSNTIALTAPASSPYELTNSLPGPAAKDNLTIVGNSDNTIEPGPGASRGRYQLVDIAAGASLTLENLQVAGFQLHSGSPGGAIYNQGALTLSAVTVKGNGLALNVSDEGANALGGAIWSSGSLTLENGTLFEGNAAVGGSSGGGTGGPDVLNTLTAPGNAYGGAVYIAAGTANISNTIFESNYAQGGINDGEGPDGTAFGGAIYVAGGQVVIANTSMNGNGVLDGSNGPDVCYGGGLYVAGGTVTVANCTVDSNYTSSGCTGCGGGLYIAGGTVTLTNDTVESNTATYGGGIYVAPAATVDIDPITVANTINNTDSSGSNGSTANIDGTYVVT